MATQVFAPTAAKLVTYARQDDNAPKNERIGVAVNTPDEAIARGVMWLNDRAINALTKDFYDVANTSNTFDTISYVNGALSRSLIDMVAGQQIWVMATFAFSCGGGAEVGRLRLMATDDIGGAAAETAVDGARMQTLAFTGTQQGILMGMHTVTADGETSIAIQGKVDAVDGTEIRLNYAGSLVMFVVGPNIPA